MNVLQKCWKCGVLLEMERRVSFRATCDQCGSALHCCINCKFYSPGRSNDCAIPGTEYVADRSVNNFCEEFTLGNSISEPNQDKKKFDDLFK